MNINSNNMKWFSGYSLMNRLFSQKGGNKTGVSNQAGANVSGGVKYKHSNLYYDENGVPWHSKEEADRCIKGTNGSWKKIVSVSDEVKAELQRTGSTYGIADQMEDSVRAYGNLYDEIVQGCQNGTRERYVEYENSETGFRKMTMEEELSRLDRAFQKMADRADAKEMIEGEFKRLRTEGGKGLSTNASKKPQGTDGDAPETARQKMKRLAQEWRDAYRASGSKEGSMEKVMSLLNSMFHISRKV